MTGLEKQLDPDLLPAPPRARPNGG